MRKKWKFTHTLAERVLTLSKLSAINCFMEVSGKVFQVKSGKTQLSFFLATETCSQPYTPAGPLEEKKGPTAFSWSFFLLPLPPSALCPLLVSLEEEAEDNKEGKRKLTRGKGGGRGIEGSFGRKKGGVSPFERGEGGGGGSIVLYSCS